MNTITLPTIDNIYKCLTDQRYVEFILNPNNSVEYRIYRGADQSNSRSVFKLLAMSAFSPDPISFIIGLVIKSQDAGNQIQEFTFMEYNRILFWWFDKNKKKVSIEIYIGRYSVERKSPKQIIDDFL